MVFFSRGCVASAYVQGSALGSSLRANPWAQTEMCRHVARAILFVAALVLSSAVAPPQYGAASSELRSVNSARLQRTAWRLRLSGGNKYSRFETTAYTLNLRGGDDVQSAVEDAINSMRSRALDAGRQNEQILDALRLMVLYAENIVKNPTENKFRRIKASNKAFAAKLAPIDGAIDVLAACGFAAQENGGETLYTLPADAAVATLESAVQDIRKALAFSERVTSETLGAMVTTGVEEGVVEEVWRLSCVLEGHAADVRGVAVTHENKIVTVSRDDKLKLWTQRAHNPNKVPMPEGVGEERGFVFEETAECAHDYHIACAATAPPSLKFPNGLAMAGTYDYTSAGAVKTAAKVTVCDAKNATLKATLLGHTATVSALAVMPDEGSGGGGELLSASWDKTIRLWDPKTLELKRVLAGHSQAVWALLPLRGQKLLSASGDRSIKLWDTHDGKCLGTLNGHGDCVRALALLPDGSFVSAGNDCMIKMWSLDLSGNSLDTSCGFCIGTLAGHDNFIYTLAVLPNGDIVSGGEDRTVRVWHDGKCACTIRFPTTVWSVAITHDGDIAAGCADGKIRVFTQNEARMAGEVELKRYEAELAACKVSAHTMGGLQLDKLPGPEALEERGKTDGQTRVVRQGDKAFAYSWSVTSNKWEPVGEVVDSAASTDTSLSSGKQKLNGKEYDFVFEIEIEEGKKARLGMNKASNPYIVASEFIDEHDLNGDYLETIVAWLDEQMDKVCPKEVRAEKDLLDSDPFNEGKVYRAGSAAKKLNKQGQGQGGDAPKTYYDPLTGKRLGARAGEDSDSDDDTAKRPTNTPPVTHIPSSTVHSFAGAPKADSLLKKVEEVNASVEASVKLSASDLAALAHCVKSLADGGSVVGEEGVEVVVGKMFKWPGDKVLPALDVARALLMRRDVAAKLASQAMAGYSMAYAGEGGVTPAKIIAAQQKDVVLKVIMAASERAEGSGKPGAPVVFMALRALCNCFLHPEMKSLLELHIATAAQVFKGVDATHKHVQLAHASLINNYAVLFKGQPMAGGVVEALLASTCGILKALGPDSDLEAMHRVTAGGGTLIYGNVTRIAMAKDLRMPASVREKVLDTEAVKGGVGSIGSPPTQRCCYAFLELFDALRYMSPGLKVADNDDEFEKIIKYAGGKAVIVDFAASWCGPCKVIGPVFDKLATDTPQAVFVKVDVDECRSTATRFNVQAMPTFKLLHMGKEMASIQGANEAGLRELVAKVVAASGGAAINARGGAGGASPPGGGGTSPPAPAAAASAAHTPADPRSPRGGGGGSAIETGGVADPLADLD